MSQRKRSVSKLWSSLTNSVLQKSIQSFAEDLKAAVTIFTSWVACESLSEVGESSAVFYVAGFIGFSLKKSKAMNCRVCQASMVYKDQRPEPMTEVEVEEGTEEEAHRRRFMDTIKRGGLSTPTDQLYTMHLSHYAQSCLDHIRKNAEEWASLMDSPNPGATFCEKMEESEEVSHLVSNKCVFEHK